MNTKPLPELPKTIPCPHEVHEAWPDVYGLRVDGDCMAPEICHLDYIFVSPSAPLEMGKCAAILTKKGNRAVKRLVTLPEAGFLGKPLHPDSTVRPILIVETTNPEGRGVLNMDALEEVHAVVHVQKMEE